MSGEIINRITAGPAQELEQHAIFYYKPHETFAYCYGWPAGAGYFLREASWKQGLSVAE